MAWVRPSSRPAVPGARLEASVFRPTFRFARALRTGSEAVTSEKPDADRGFRSLQIA
jgi:hypothetical protein